MGLRLLFDVESDGLLRKLSVVHCIVAMDLDTKQVFRFNDQGGDSSVTGGVTLLMEADELWGHNIVGYDIPALSQIYPFFQPKGIICDTLIMSRVFFSDILARDIRKKPIGMPGNLYGRHSLEAWGYRLGEYKGQFAKTTDWSEWSEELENYCLQDVKVTTKLWKLFLPRLV